MSWCAALCATLCATLCGALVQLTVSCALAALTKSITPVGTISRKTATPAAPRVTKFVPRAPHTLALADRRQTKLRRATVDNQLHHTYYSVSVRQYVTVRGLLTAGVRPRARGVVERPTQTTKDLCGGFLLEGGGRYEVLFASK